MSSFQDSSFASSSSSTQVNYNEGLRSFFVGIYNQMIIALVITGVTSLFVSNSPALMNLFFATGLKWVVMFAPLGLALFLGFKINSMQPSNARFVFFIYSLLMGISLSTIFMIYNITSITKVFFITAATFGLTSLYGYTTKADLSKFSSILMMGMIGIFVASLVNLFLQSGTMDFVISIIAVIVFTAMIAYDTQNMKSIYYNAYYNAGAGHSSVELQRYAVIGALSLYMSFVILFTHLLNLLGERE